MKKLVLAMACVLSLGLLASCKQGVQDVNLQNQDKTEAGEFYGKLEGTFKLQTTTGAGTTLAYTDATTTSSLKGSENWVSLRFLGQKQQMQQIQTIRLIL